MFIDSCSCLCPFSGYYWEMSVPLSIFPIAHLLSRVTSSLNILFSRLSNSNSLSLSLCIGCSIHLIPFVVFYCTHSTMSTSALLWGGQNWSHHFREVSAALSKDHFPGLLAMFCLMHSRLLTGFHCHKSTLQIHGQHVVCLDWRIFCQGSSKPFCNQPVQVQVLFLLRWRT